MPFNVHVFYQLALLCCASAAAVPQQASTSPQALYFLTNADQGNVVRALPIGSDGRLSYGGAYATGGKGSSLILATPGDALSSQGAIQVIGNYLFAVNAGSNTLSMFSIDQDCPEKLTLLGKPTNTLGDFPVTVAVSGKIPGMVCVGNTGTKSGIACFKYGTGGLTALDNTLHPLPLDPAPQNPPPGPFNLVGQILFNDDATQLLATVKGSPGTNNTGYIGSYPFRNGISGKLVQTSPKGTLVLFGSVALPGNKIFTTDASFGAAVMQISAAGQATLLHKYAIPTNKASCWAVMSPETGLVYVTDAGANTIVALNPTTASPNATTTMNSQDLGLLDTAVGGNWLYALASGNGTHPPAIVVMETQQGSGKVVQLQNFLPNSVNSNVKGLAIY